MFLSSVCCCENYSDVKHKIIILLESFSCLEYFNAGYKNKSRPQCGEGDWDIFTHSANTWDLLPGLSCEVLASNSWLPGNQRCRVGTVLTLVSGELWSVWPVNFCIWTCYCASSLTVLPERFLGGHVVFELQYSYGSWQYTSQNLPHLH